MRNTNRAVQPQNMARGLKFRIYEVEGLYYSCIENKGADQLRGNRDAELRLCFRICKKKWFSHNEAQFNQCYEEGLWLLIYPPITKASRKQLFESGNVIEAYAKGRFSNDAAH